METDSVIPPASFPSSRQTIAKVSRLISALSLKAFRPSEIAVAISDGTGSSVSNIVSSSSMIAI
ncbi:hypothetical protein HFO56_09575 [Rhizobium laguerreae]|nr:hypothetical protein [Rhizobium laguerreae]MBY3152605.1 hypothetical protein [Rhizobium laguerreae]